MALACTLVVTGCGPKYPNCNGDKDCREKEFCVNGKCQQCRPNEQDCPSGQECHEGACRAIAGYCTDHSQCPEDQSCINHACKPCTINNECGDGKCHKGRCKPKDFCVTDNDCPQDKDCLNGRCVSGAVSRSPAPTTCSLEGIYFDFNESALTTAATSALQRNANCLKQTGRSVILEGHADPRGTDEYNLALTDRRARSVKRYLTTMGVEASKMRPLPKGETEARGTDEPGWAKDRRVEFIWE